MKKYSRDEISEILFLHLLALCILDYVDHTAAAHYAHETMQYPAFDGIRLSATDLCNLIATLWHAERYLDESRDVPIPLLALKRWIRGVSNGERDPSQLRSLFTRMQDVLKIKNSQQNMWRRDVTDCRSLLPREIHHIADGIYNRLRKFGYSSDLVVILHHWLENNEDSR